MTHRRDNPTRRSLRTSAQRVLDRWIMRADWNCRARKNPLHYVATESGIGARRSSLPAARFPLPSTFFMTW